MRYIAIIAAVVLLSGCTGILSGQPQMGGVAVLDTEKFSVYEGTSGMCSAKVKNTNSYNVTVTYQFDGTDAETETIRPSSETKQGWTLINGQGCFSPEIELLSVERTN